MGGGDDEQDHEVYINDFLEDLTKFQCPGRNSTIFDDDETRTPDPHFIPNSTIIEYFKYRPRLEGLLEAATKEKEVSTALCDTVQQSYLIVFCILLRIDKGRFIKQFTQRLTLTDHRLPFTECPQGFPIANDGDSFFKAFYDMQWVFCPHVFKEGRDLVILDDYVLPMKRKNLIASGKDATTNKATITEVMIHQECFRYSGSHPPPSVQGSDATEETFVIKTYRTHEGQRIYHNEIKAYHTITRGGKLPPAIIGYRGAFRYKDTYNIIFEYANKGTLASYLEEQEPPFNRKDIISLWQSMSDIVDAIGRIHEVESPDVENNDNGERKTVTQGIHQDIKPPNIFVIGAEEESRYDWKFKLGDLGLTQFKKSSATREDGTYKDQFGTKTYGAPECYRDNQWESQSRIMITRACDIYSLGTVLSEFVTWLVFGKSGIDKYDKARRAAHKKIPGFRDTGCFHDGNKTLTVVREQHNDCRDKVRANDPVTISIIGYIDQMLQRDPEDRPTAKELGRRLRRDVERASAQHSPYDQDIPEEQDDMQGARYPARFPRRSGRYIEDGTNRLHHSPDGIEMDSRLPIRGLSSSEGPFRPVKQKAGTAISVEQQERSPRRRAYTDGIPNHSVTPPVSDGSISGHRHSRSERNVTMRSQMPCNNSRVSEESNTSSIVPPQKDEAMDKTKDGPGETSKRARPTHLSLEEAVEWNKGKRDKKGKRRKKPIEIEADHLLTELGEQGKRDIVFLFDESPTMEAHLPDAVRLVSVLAYRLKDCDPDGMELRFVGTPTKKSQHRHSTELTNKLERVSFSKAKLNITISLEEILGAYERELNENKRSLFRKHQPVPLLNLYILTDGAWQPRADPSSTIRRLAKVLDERGMRNDQVGIQFIRFGDDELGMKRLEYLDSNKRMRLKRDIVDTTPFKGANILKIILGAINKWYDDDPDDGEFDPNATPEPFPGT